MSEKKIFPDPTEADLGAAKAAHARVLTFTAAGHTVLCKPLPRSTWKRIQHIQKNADSEDDITEVILGDTLVYPSRDKLEALLEDYPAAFEPIALDLITLAKGEALKRGKAA